MALATVRALNLESVVIVASLAPPLFSSSLTLRYPITALSLGVLALSHMLPVPNFSASSYRWPVLSLDMLKVCHFVGIHVLQFL